MTIRSILKAFGWVLIGLSVVANVVVAITVARHPLVVAALRAKPQPTVTTGTVVGRQGSDVTIRSASGAPKTVSVSATTSVRFVTSTAPVPLPFQLPLPASSTDLQHGAKVVVVESMNQPGTADSIAIDTDWIRVGKVTSAAADKLTLDVLTGKQNETASLTLGVDAKVAVFGVDTATASAKPASLVIGDIHPNDIVLFRTDMTPTDTGASIVQIVRLPAPAAPKS